MAVRRQEVAGALGAGIVTVTSEAVVAARSPRSITDRNRDRGGVTAVARSLRRARVSDLNQEERIRRRIELRQQDAA